MFDLSGVKENSFSPLPEGKYPVECLEASIHDTKDGTGKYIKLKLRVLGGEHNDRILFTNFNVVNKSDKAAEIGKGQLKSFMRVGGIKDFNRLEDVRDLVGLKVIATVKVRDSDYGEQNDISYFKEFDAKRAETLGVTKKPDGDLPF